MIQGTIKSNIEAYLQTEDNRIDTGVTTSQIGHLVKFTNDMDKSVQYAYAFLEQFKERYNYFLFIYDATPNVYTGRINLIPAGYWKYEVYEVSWQGTRTISEGNAPITETQVLTPAADDKGVVQGLVTKGKMYLAEYPGQEQVQYTQRQEPSGTNYIYYGQ